MRICLLALALLTLFSNCKNKKASLQGDEQIGQKDFIDAFPKAELPFAVYDTNMNIIKDTTTISQAVFARFAPDTMFIVPFGKDRKFSIHPIARHEVKGKETYLLIYVNGRNKEAVYVVVLDDKNKFSAFLPLVFTNTNEQVVTSATIDKKLGVTVYDEWKKDEAVYYKRNTYAYNNVGAFTLVLNETNDLTNKSLVEMNPLDTFPKTYKYSGDYFRGKSNFISLRDGKNPQQYQFYVRFENGDEEKCSGELKGELTLLSPTTGVYKQDGNPCIIDFSLTATQVKFKEQGSCGNYRGIKCFFNDTYTKKKEPKAKKKK